MPVEIITSLQNPRLKRLVRLRDRRSRDEERAFLVEGYREIRRALEKKVRIDELYFCPDWFLGSNEPTLIAEAEAAGKGVVLVDGKLIENLHVSGARRLVQLAQQIAEMGAER